MNSKKNIFILFNSFLIILLLPFIPVYPAIQQEALPITDQELRLLKLLDIIPCEESVDYVQNKTQFQLHTLLTEQRHPQTWNLSERIKRDCQAGLRMLFSVDQDISKRLEALTTNKELIEQAAHAIEDALLSGNRIYIYGCGATGRLAKQMESTFWRPFWEKVKGMEKIWRKIKPHVEDPIEEQLIGEMTGADRALISSLEGFEDLLLIGRLQLEEREIRQGDVVICVTEGGETSSVIGTVLAALDQWKTSSRYDPEKTRKKLYFVYNNPDERLLPFDRSQIVLEEPGITKINLSTGPQAISGSTRMQATTIETFVIANILQASLDSTLRNFLSKKDMAKLGFKKEINLEEKLKEFPLILKQVRDNIPAITKFTELEEKTYRTGHFSTYFAKKGLITVFIDSTERSPTFRLFPLDTVKQKKRKSWIQVWTPTANLNEAWHSFLGRPFRGLSSEFYRKPFEEKIEDFYLKNAALESLKNAGDNQGNLYDFSFSEFNIKNRGPVKGDLGVCLAVSPEEAAFSSKNSDFRKFIELFLDKGASTAILLITDRSDKYIAKTLKGIPEFKEEEDHVLINININDENDPLGINQQIALKIILNAHSTAVMARFGKVIGNTMTNVSPSNLKLIGRATYLIQSHVNDVLSNPHWVKFYGIRKPISYGEANAVLFESIGFLKDIKTKAGQTAEVALSIIRILESLRLKNGISQEESFKIVKDKGLSSYIYNVVSQEN